MKAGDRFMKEIHLEKIKVKFVVKRISFRDEENHFTILKATFKEYDSNFSPTSDLVIKGYFVSLFEGDEYEGIGHWVRDSIWGWQFVLQEHKRVLPSSLKEIQVFLSKFVKGCGVKNAKAIVDFYRENTFKAIEEGWENIAKVKGISEKKARLIQEKYIEHKYFENVALFVMQFGVGYKTCIRIYEAFGQTSILKIKENPYCLCKVDRIDFFTADKFAKMLGRKHNCPARIQEAILDYLDYQMSQKGHLYIMKETLQGELNLFLEKKGAYGSNQKVSQAEIELALNALENDKIVIEQNKNRDSIYLKLYNIIENRIVNLLQRLIKEEKPLINSTSQIEKFIHDYEKSGYKFATAQKEALYTALQNGISILTGGPGTGKSETINSIIQCLKNAKKDALIELTAPTGKASKRLTELTGMEAKTIHRLIGLNESVESNVVKEVIADLLIVDESSMIDAYVFYKLLTAIESQTRVVLVGDFEQLPSVGPGLILRDLINSGKIPTTRLTEIFRQAKDSQIVTNAHAILKEDPTALSFNNSKNDCYWIETNEKFKVQSKMFVSIDRLIHSKRFTLDDIQVLSPMSKGELGTLDLNRLIQEKFNERNLLKKEYKVNATTLFREGDKVIQTINNYGLGVFNGEVGKITGIENDGDDSRITVDFGDKLIDYDTLNIEELVLAYAISIHKSQGSEFKCVIMPIHESQKYMLNKNLIYTGITRAREMVAFIGQIELFNTSILKNDNTVRNSCIREKIIKSL